MYEKKIVMKVTQEEYDSLMKLSKCWSCAKACTKGCNWSKRFQPVSGWTAVKRIMRRCNSEGEYVSYFVKECPQYDCDVVVKQRAKPKPAQTVKKPGVGGTPVYVMMRDGRFQLFDSLSEAAKVLKKTDPKLKDTPVTSLKSAIGTSSKEAKKYFYCRGHLFKKHE